MQNPREGPNQEVRRKRLYKIWKEHKNESSQVLGNIAKGKLAEHNTLEAPIIGNIRKVLKAKKALA